LSTSAINTIVEHNRRTSQTLLAVPRVAPERSIEQTSKTACAASTTYPDR
jgi:hypothetical protein